MLLTVPRCAHNPLEVLFVQRRCGARRLRGLLAGARVEVSGRRARPRRRTAALLSRAISASALLEREDEQ